VGVMERLDEGDRDLDGDGEGGGGDPGVRVSEIEGVSDGDPVSEDDNEIEEDGVTVDVLEDDTVRVIEIELVNETDGEELLVPVRVPLRDREIDGVTEELLEVLREIEEVSDSDGDQVDDRDIDSDDDPERETLLENEWLLEEETDRVGDEE
jgi:hypothetical protein